MIRRHSKKREQILDVLKREHNALSANDIHSKLPRLNLTTIYRNLELFLKKGLIQKVSVDTHEASYEYAREPHYHAVCNECEKIIHFKASDEKIRKLLKLKKFQIQEVDITVRGTCGH